ncbi:hypothetical protein ACFPN7_48055 [Amycolatopsis halotolerans]|uniref:hypothetical protein n=1 Tax=Amycolatopsis halotolerans TaxID=330083 RepID=UPI00360DAC7A
MDTIRLPGVNACRSALPASTNPLVRMVDIVVLNRTGSHLGLDDPVSHCRR